MIEFIHLTAQYSNAVLVAIMPHVSDFAAKMELPVPQPITASQVAECRVLPWAGHIGAGVWLTNHYWFEFNWHGDGYHGLVTAFSAPTNWFSVQEFTEANVVKFFGSDHMTTNEAVALARVTLKKVGYEPNITHADQPPTDIEGPFYSSRFKRHIPYCVVEWVWPSEDEDHPANHHNSIRVQINLETKTVVGLSTAFALTNKPPTVYIKPSVEPELESDFQKRTRGHIFTDTNAPPRKP